MKNNKLYQWLKAKYVYLRDRYLYLRRHKYIKMLEKIIDKDTTIISSNCFAGRIMQDLKMQYNSPTLGLWMMPDDFSVFCSDLRHYLSADIVEVKHSKNELGEYKMTHPAQHPYPVGLIDGRLEVHFLHYYSLNEAVDKWKRRAVRVNFDRLIMIGSEQNGCTEEDVKAFNAIPFAHKLYFCSKPYPYACVVYIPEFASLGYVGDPYKKGHIFYKYLVKWFEEKKVL